MRESRFAGLFVLGLGLALLLVFAVGCRGARTLEELEERGDSDDAQPTMEMSDLGEIDDFERARRIFAPTDTPLFEPVRFALSARTDDDRSIRLTAGLCYTMLAVASPIAHRIDMGLLDPEGRLVASDDAADGFPVISHFCPTESGLWTLRVRAGDADATVQLGVFRTGEEELAEGAAALRELAGRYLAGARPLGPVHREHLREGERWRTQLHVDEGRCFGIVASGGEGVVDVDAALYNPAGIREKQDIGTDASPVVERTCASRPGLWRLELMLYRGGGDVYWQLWRWPQ